MPNAIMAPDPPIALKNNQKKGKLQKEKKENFERGGGLQSPRTLWLEYYTIIQKVHLLGIWEYKYVVVIRLIEGQKYPCIANL